MGVTARTPSWWGRREGLVRPCPVAWRLQTLLSTWVFLLEVCGHQGFIWGGHSGDTHSSEVPPVDLAHRRLRRNLWRPAVFQDSLLRLWITAVN